MYKTSKETKERKDAKQQFILETAAKVFAKKGYHNTSVKDIVDEAEISVGSFYFYFKSKEEIFIKLYQKIEKEFNDQVNNIINTKNCGLAQNFTRAITTNLWMYQKNRDIAKIMLIEAFSLNPDFEQIRSQGMRDSCLTMENLLKKIKMNHSIYIPDERTASLAYQGTFYYLINDWLESDASVKLTDSAYALCIYNLQALKVTFEEEEIKKYIKEVLEELNQQNIGEKKGDTF
jgi:AcrR family transcriptional regulator